MVDERGVSLYGISLASAGCAGPLPDPLFLGECGLEARSRSRNPVALGRMESDQQESSATYYSDKPTDPTAGSETTDALEFLARLTSHIPDKVQVLQRYYGFYSSRQRGTPRKANGAGVHLTGATLST